VSTLYDAIGKGYALQRSADPRIAAQIQAALGNASSLVNIGAGAGSYEPSDCMVIAVEPSQAMLEQRREHHAHLVRGISSPLPLRSNSVDAALAVLTVHHWPNRLAGLCEMRRVSRGPVVALTWDPAAADFWLADYFPRLIEIDRKIFPGKHEFEAAWGELNWQNVPVPADCQDGFLAAYWARPQLYLNAAIRAAMSSFGKLARPEIDAGLSALAEALRSGAWQARHQSLLSLPELDTGYRIAVSPASSTS
jgi:SAM-dependent methyltransferase